MTQKGCEHQESVSFSATELRDVISLTQKVRHQNSQCRIFSDDNDKERFEAIIIFIEKVLNSIRRIHIRKLIIYEMKNITLIRSNSELEFEIAFKHKEIKKSVFDKLHNNTKIHIVIKNKKGGSVLSIIPEKEAVKK